MDLLGAGYSGSPPEFDYSMPAHAAYLKEFVDGLGVRDVVLFGHSLGGPVAIELAKLCGSRVRALVLSEANLDPSRAGSGSYQVAQLPEEEFAGGGMDALIAESRACGNTMWAAALSHCAPCAVHRLSRCALRGGAPLWRTALYELPVQKGFIFGERSLPDADYEELPRHGIRAETVPSAGHSMAWENPAGLAEAISRCL